MPELIDRQAALKKMCETCGYCKGFEEAMRSIHPDFVTDKCNNYKFLAEQPTIEAEPVLHGRWLPIEADGYADGAPVWDKWECSECGHEHSGEEDTLTAFCPDCGSMNLEV
jgi:hypothetical protein